MWNSDSEVRIVLADMSAMFAVLRLLSECAVYGKYSYRRDGSWWCIRLGGVEIVDDDGRVVVPRSAHARLGISMAREGMCQYTWMSVYGVDKALGCCFRAVLVTVSQKY